jgi:hypothetical protein
VLQSQKAGRRSREEVILFRPSALFDRCGGNAADAVRYCNW